MRLLPVASCLDDGHDDVLGRHERQLLCDAPRHNLRVNDHALGYVLQRLQDHVRGQERLRKRDAAVRAAGQRSACAPPGLRASTHLSSSVRSNHCVPAVVSAFCWSAHKCRASEHTRSLRMGLRLYAIADDPIWPASNGSSTSLRFASRRRSVESLCAVEPNDASVPRTSASILREYVCDETG